MSIQHLQPLQPSTFGIYHQTHILTSTTNHPSSEPHAFKASVMQYPEHPGQPKGFEQLESDSKELAAILPELQEEIYELTKEREDVHAAYKAGRAGLADVLAKDSELEHVRQQKEGRLMMVRQSLADCQRLRASAGADFYNREEKERLGKSLLILNRVKVEWLD